jgi:3,4-dihydroxy-2-butanone 4-phosphate synthase
VDSVPAAALGLCQLSGIAEATVMGHLVGDDAEVMTVAEAASFGVRHALASLQVSDVMRRVIALRTPGLT